METPLLARCAASRVAVALVLAPLAPCVVLALEGLGEWWLVPALLYAYYFGLLGILAYFVFRSLGWLRFWQVLAGGAGLGGVIAVVFVSSSVAPRFASLGALTAVVFWVLACVPLRTSRSTTGF
jgi:hypothetical protein